MMAADPAAAFVDTNVLVYANQKHHDANLVATMLAHRVPRLLTFNAADFTRFGILIEVVSP